MKLLIVDDEKITREGLLGSLNLKSIGITQVLQADDGVHGLELALLHRPEIVLTDVRMPRMDGIQMAEQITEQLSGCSIIFMSGYSDKEYLKAAIKLKAINYVEKPIDLKEVTDALIEAVTLKQTQTQNRHTAASSYFSSLAAKLQHPLSRQEWSYLSKSDGFPLPMGKHIRFTTVLIKLHPLTGSLSDAERETVELLIAGVLENRGLSEIHSAKEDGLFIYHIWGYQECSPAFADSLIDSWQKVFSSLQHSYYIIWGKQATGLENVHQSYTSAVILLQKAFFYPVNSCLKYREETHESFHPNDIMNGKFQQDFSGALSGDDENRLAQIAADLLKASTGATGLLPNQVKGLYFHLLSEIRNVSEQKKMSFTTGKPEDSIWDSISRCDSIYELHKLLCREIEKYFALAKTVHNDNSTIYLIKDFISKNYQHEDLSIRDISDFVHLTSSYTCTLFKTETGTTLNQYLTEYRIRRARFLLSDPRNKIADIASLVGYSDSNYFGKTFKKSMGLSPSEYREQELNK